MVEKGMLTTSQHAFEACMHTHVLVLALSMLQALSLVCLQEWRLWLDRWVVAA